MNGVTEETVSTPASPAIPTAEEAVSRRDPSPYGLSYQINIVLPETKEIEVFDAIFRKLKEHLL